MHEYPITVQIIEIAVKYAKENNTDEVKQINLVVGDCCGYVSSSIELYFPIIAENTICEKASLRIERVKSKMKCSNCEKLFERIPYSFSCPFCGGDGLMTGIGKEFYVKSIVV